MAELLERVTVALADRYRVERELGAGGMATVRLEAWWEISRRGEAALAAAGPIRGNEDAWAVADAMASPQHPETAAATESMLARIAALAGAA